MSTTKDDGREPGLKSCDCGGDVMHFIRDDEESIVKCSKCGKVWDIEQLWNERAASREGVSERVSQLEEALAYAATMLGIASDWNAPKHYEMEVSEAWDETKDVESAEPNWVALYLFVPKLWKIINDWKTATTPATQSADMQAEVVERVAKAIAEEHMSDTKFSWDEIKSDPSWHCKQAVEKFKKEAIAAIAALSTPQPAATQSVRTCYCGATGGSACTYERKPGHCIYKDAGEVETLRAVNRVLVDGLQKIWDLGVSYDRSKSIKIADNGNIIAGNTLAKAADIAKGAI